MPVRVLKRKPRGYSERAKEGALLRGIGSAAMEAEKSASWRPSKGFQPEGLTTRSIGVWRPETMDALAQAGRQPAPQGFGSAGPSADWMVPTCIGKGHLLYSVYCFQCSSLPETASQTHPEIMFYRLSGHPFTLSSHKIHHHAVLRD